MQKKKFFLYSISFFNKLVSFGKKETILEKYLHNKIAKYKK